MNRNMLKSGPFVIISSLKCYCQYDAIYAGWSSTWVVWGVSKKVVQFGKIQVWTVMTQSIFPLDVK
jgi:hypothetical protein